MIQLQRPERRQRGSSFSTKYLTLLIAATMAIVLWGYQRIYSEEPTYLFLVLGIVLAALAFALAIKQVMMVWKNHKQSKKINTEE